MRFLLCGYSAAKLLTRTGDIDGDLSLPRPGTTSTVQGIQFNIIVVRFVPYFVLSC